MKPTVYLAGPIAGQNHSGATGWREEAIRQFDTVGIKGLCPLRGVVDAGIIFTATGDDEAHRKSNIGPRELMTRDRFDCLRCDVLLVNLLDAERVSIGTMMELAWADIKRTPVVCVMESGNVHEHAMVGEAIGWRCDTLQEGIDTVKRILL